MIVRIDLPEHQIEANVRCVGPDGQPVEVSHIEIEPFFYRSDARAVVLYHSIHVADKEHHRGLLHIAGKTGMLSSERRAAPVVSQFERDVSRPKKNGKKSEEPHA